jgi:hypothetical protein
MPIPAYTGNSGAARVAVIGDSLVQAGNSEIRAALEGDYALSVRGINNQRIDQLLPVVDRYASTNPDRVVVALGANDSLQSWPLDMSVAAMSRLLDRLSATPCVAVLTMTSTTESTAFNTNSAQLNARLAQLQTSRPNVMVFEWGKVVDDYKRAGSPFGTWTTDSLHYTPLGRTAFANAIRDAARGCG